MNEVTARERNNPTQDELEEVLGLLIAANDAGQLASIVFMLKNGENAVVDYRGSQEHTELACRTVNRRIAEEVEREHPNIASAIRRDLHKDLNS